MCCTFVGMSIEVCVEVYGSGFLAMQVLSACSQSILLLGVLCWFFFVSFHFVIIVMFGILLLRVHLLVSCYPFKPLWVTGDRDIPWFSLSLV